MLSDLTLKMYLLYTGTKPQAPQDLSFSTVTKHHEPDTLELAKPAKGHSGHKLGTRSAVNFFKMKLCLFIKS